jgi:hypothetical protein
MRTKIGLQAAWLATIGAMVAAVPMRASAATASVSSADGVGGMIYSMASDIANPVGMLLIAGAYLTGFWLAYSGLMAFYRGSNGDHHRYAEGLLKLVGCALLCSLPDTFGVGVATFFGSNGSYTGNLATAFANHAVQDCTTVSGDAGITCVAKNVATNLVPIFVETSFVLMKVLGFCMGGSLIYKLAASQNERGRGLPDGWTVQMGVAFILCNAPSLWAAAETSLGVSNPLITGSGAQGLGQSGPPSMLAYTYSGSGAGTLLASYQQLIGWCFVILVMFGIVAMWRGIMQLKAHAEGNKQGGGLGSAFVHIIAGVILANGKYGTCLAMTSIIGQGLGFCS